MPTVLVVDDGKVDQRLAGLLLKDQMQVLDEYADNGRQALDLIRQRLPEVVVTDMKMPVMDGLELVEAIRREHRSLPVIVMTAVGSEELAAEALQKGATSYVPKRRLAQDLAKVVQRHVTQESEHHPHVVRECLDYVETRFTLDNDCSRIAPLVTYLQEHLAEMDICDEMAVMHVGVALEEALTNAIHHGNLELKSDLYEGTRGAFAAELSRRQNEPPYRDRRVHLTAKTNRDSATYVLRDEGPGFDKSVIPNLKTLVKDHPSGRGLLLILSVMDEVTFNDKGNEITMVKRRST